MKRENKKLVIGIIIGLLLAGTISMASTLITGNVYINQFGILLNGKEYTPELPILNYSDFTYVPLRELATLTGNEVDFKDSKIVINNKAGETSSVKVEDLIGEWIPFYAEKNGKQVDLVSIYGTGIEYAGSLNLFDDGSYTNYIGIYSIDEEDSYYGNYIFRNNEILLKNKKGNYNTVSISYDNNGKMILKVPDRGYEVVYYKIEQKYIDITKVTAEGTDFIVTVQEYERYKLDDKQMADMKNGKEITLPDYEGNMINLKFSKNSMNDGWRAETIDIKTKNAIDYSVDKDGYYECSGLQNGEIYRKVGAEKEYYYNGDIHYGEDNSTISIRNYIGINKEAKQYLPHSKIYGMDIVDESCIKIRSFAL